MDINFYYNKEKNDLIDITSEQLDIQINGYIKIEPNTVEAAKEKHIPYISVEDNNILYIQIGAVMHPMTQEHYISDIYVLADSGIYYRKSFKLNEKPELTIDVSGAKNVKVYSHCNLHGVWKAEINI